MDTSGPQALGQTWDTRYTMSNVDSLGVVTRLTLSQITLEVGDAVLMGVDLQEA